MQVSKQIMSGTKKDRIGKVNPTDQSQAFSHYNKTILSSNAIYLTFMFIKFRSCKIDSVQQPMKLYEACGMFGNSIVRTMLFL